MTQTLYLDHNATTPIWPEVADAVREASLRFKGNPASQHEPGRAARRKLEELRERVGQFLGAKTTGMDADRVIFTSGGTEANNLALFGLIGGRNAPPGHLAVSAIEHPSILAAATELSRCGWSVDHPAVGADGRVQVDQAIGLLSEETRMVALMLANNETGVLQPVEALAAECAERRIPLHCDACQAAGKLPIDFRKLGAATLSVAAHKFHGPLGIGALVVRHGTALKADLYGGFQQSGFRPGTESVALATGLCLALEIWAENNRLLAEQVGQLRDRFEATLCQELADAVVVAQASARLPGTSNIALVGLDRQALMMALDGAGIACSTGSACASGSREPSPTLLAMGLENRVAGSSVRFSFGATTTAAEIDEACRRILGVCKQLRRDGNR